MKHGLIPARTVFFVDDNHSDRKIFEFAIRELAPESRVRSFAHSDILDVLDADLITAPGTPFLIFIDINLIPGEGTVLIRNIREIHDGQHLHIIAMSGQSDPEVWRRSYESGANLFWEKPMNLDQMMSELSGILRLGDRFPVLKDWVNA